MLEKHHYFRDDSGNITKLKAAIVPLEEAEDKFNTSRYLGTFQEFYPLEVRTNLLLGIAKDSDNPGPDFVLKSHRKREKAQLYHGKELSCCGVHLKDSTTTRLTRRDLLDLTESMTDTDELVICTKRGDCEDHVDYEYFRENLCEINPKGYSREVLKAHNFAYRYGKIAPLEGSDLASQNTLEKIDLTGFLKPNCPYSNKDVAKFKECTKLISRGARYSSSWYYSKHPLANTGDYCSSDTVGISVNGKRRNRIPADFVELHQAIKSGVKVFVLDSLGDRNRTFNVGEREVTDYLIKQGYKELGISGVFTKRLHHKI